MRTRFYNAQVLTMKDFDIFLGEVWVKDNKIIYVGKSKKILLFVLIEKIDVQKESNYARIY